MRSWKCAALVAGLVVAALRAAPPPAQEVAIAAGVSSVTAVTTIGPACVEDAAGGSLRSWWGQHGATVAEIAGCMLDGVALGRCIALGVAASGGAVAAAALLVAGIACVA